MNARPATSAAVAPVVTLSVPLAAPSVDVYATAVHGSSVTLPV